MFAASGLLNIVFSPSASLAIEIRFNADACYHGWVVNLTNSPTRSGLHAVFLDRDGVLNEKLPEDRYVTSWSDFRVLPGVPEAIARLNRVGLRVFIVSNQRGIALGLYTASDVLSIHSAFQNLLKKNQARVDGFYFCPHDEGQCNCRKPLPGLFEQAVADFPEITAATSAMIGDSLPDIEFGRSLGMHVVYIEGNPERQKLGARAAMELADLRSRSLAEAVDRLLE
jgi:histidinol-phosphate phosphatase family protein